MSIVALAVSAHLPGKRSADCHTADYPALRVGIRRMFKKVNGQEVPPMTSTVVAGSCGQHSSTAGSHLARETLALECIGLEPRRVVSGGDLHALVGDA